MSFGGHLFIVVLAGKREARELAECELRPSQGGRRNSSEQVGDLVLVLLMKVAATGPGPKEGRKMGRQSLRNVIDESEIAFRK